MSRGTKKEKEENFMRRKGLKDICLSRLRGAENKRGMEGKYLNTENCNKKKNEKG